MNLYKCNTLRYTNNERIKLCIVLMITEGGNFYER